MKYQSKISTIKKILNSRYKTLFECIVWIIYCIQRRLHMYLLQVLHVHSLEVYFKDQ